MSGCNNLNILLLLTFRYAPEFHYYKKQYIQIFGGFSEQVIRKIYRNGINRPKSMNT